MAPEKLPSQPVDPRLLDELGDLAVRVAEGAASVLSRYDPAELQQVSTKSSPTDLVSEADKASEEYILQMLRRARPTDSVAGEEGSNYEGTSGISWIFDPLDGTTNFFFGIPAYCVSVAARYQGRTVVGAVVDPSRRETWSAALGKGSYCNAKPCRVADSRSQLSTALVATGFGYGPDRRADQAALLPALLPKVRDIRRFGSAAIDLCWVASGRFDAFYESHLKDWDWAAGRLICEEAGGHVQVLGDELLLATTPSLSEPLARLLQEAQSAAPRSQTGHS